MNTCSNRGGEPTKRQTQKRQRRRLPKLRLLLTVLVTALVTAFGLTACEQSAPSASLQAAPTDATVGDSVTLTWRSVGAASCTLTTGRQTLTPESCAQGSVAERYNQAGAVTTTFVATTQNGFELRRKAVINVSAAAAGQAFTTEQDSLTVTFGAAPAAGTSFVWDFGDGETGSGVRALHTYAQSGDFLVTLTQTRAGEQTSSAQTVTVRETAQPETRIPLFSGDGLGAWERVRGGTANWRTQADYAEVKPGQRVGDNNLKTKETFGDFRLHLEFWVPKTPAGTPEQTRGNSGVYLQGRYEVQILDSYGRTLNGQNDAGAVYEVQDAAKNASLPPETWQTYDIEFYGARFENGDKVRDARVSVSWNGQLVQDETVIPGPTRLGSPESSSDVGRDGILLGPIVLQDHGYRVRFRNIWLEPL